MKLKVDSEDAARAVCRRHQATALAQAALRAYFEDPTGFDKMTDRTRRRTVDAVEDELRKILP